MYRSASVERKRRASSCRIPFRAEQMPSGRMQILRSVSLREGWRWKDRTNQMNAGDDVSNTAISISIVSNSGNLRPEWILFLGVFSILLRMPIGPRMVKFHFSLLVIDSLV